MAEQKTYTNAKSFRTSLEQRLAQISAKEKIDIQRLRKQVSFDRLLARLFLESPAPWALKGGYAMQLRMDLARATKDIDLAVRDEKLFSENGEVQNDKLFEFLQEKASQDLKDFFEFTVKAPTLDIDAAPYGGARFPIEARLDNRPFEKFHLDIGIGDIWFEPLETLNSRDWLSFAGIKSQSIIAVSKEQQFAEKLHAYTLPRENNSRVKDLVDLALLVQSGNLNKSKLQKAIKDTFIRRKTHELPNELLSPPEDWSSRFTGLAGECQLNQSISIAFKAVRQFVSSLV